MIGRTEFLGVGFDALDAAAVETWLADRPVEAPFGYVVTPNVDHVVRLAAAPPPLHEAYAEADLCLCDSRVLQRLARMMGVRLTLVPGSDLVAGLLGRVARPGDRIGLVGGTAAGAYALAGRYPQFDWVHHTPPMGLAQDAAARTATAKAIIGLKARFVLLAVGAPQQELIAHEVACAGRGRGTALCIGAGADFLTGAQRHAPGMVQRAGMEWAWRLAGDPRRLARRYLIEGPAVFPLAWRWWRGRRTSA